jgi:hypothetical protein
VVPRLFGRVKVYCCSVTSHRICGTACRASLSRKSSSYWLLFAYGPRRQSSAGVSFGDSCSSANREYVNAAVFRPIRSDRDLLICMELMSVDRICRPEPWGNSAKSKDFINPVGACNLSSIVTKPSHFKCVLHLVQIMSNLWQSGRRAFLNCGLGDLFP